MSDSIPEDVLALLGLMTHLETTMPTIVEVVEASAAEDAPFAVPDVYAALESALDLGLVDAADDYGPETLFTLSTLGAEAMQVRMTWDSRRWVDRRSGRLLGPPNPLYRPRRRKPRVADEDVMEPLWASLVSDEPGPEEVAILAEEAARKPYDGDDNPPHIHRFYGLNAPWNGPEAIEGQCPHCGGAVLSIHAYCLKCHNAGMDRFIRKPPASRRRQMPKGQTLKGGV